MNPDPADAIPSPAPNNIPTFAVSELAQAVRRRLESDFERVRVRGEISGCKLHSSGHAYLSLKDEGSVLASICWRGVAGKFKQWLQDGLEVIATGQLTTYPGRSQYQLVIDHIEPAGVGALLKMIEDRKKKLAAEGLFDPARKRPLPFLPTVIAVITSPTGAVIRDILHRLNDRCPVRVLVYPVAVQGDGAAAQIAAAIEQLNQLPLNDGAIPRPDLLIIARGGGSVEDLMPFNEEVVVRAAAGSSIPLISAVGHETDHTLIDLVADLRAPTPTASAEMAVPVKTQLILQLQDHHQRLSRGALQQVASRQTLLQHLNPAHPARLLLFAQQRLDDLSARLRPAATTPYQRGVQAYSTLPLRLHQTVERLFGQAEEKILAPAARLAPILQQLWQSRSHSLEMTGRLLTQLSYQQTLARGFVMVQRASSDPSKSGTIVSSCAALDPTTPTVINLVFADGVCPAQAYPATTAAAQPTPPAKLAKPRSATAAQNLDFFSS